MRSMRLVILGIFALLLPVSAAAKLTDIDDYVYKSSIELLYSYGIIDGYADNTFQPHRLINRAEFLKLVMLSAYGDQSYKSSVGRCFADFLGSTSQWFWQHACAAKELGIIHGHPDGTFRGEDTVLLGEALKMSLEAWHVDVGPDDPRLAWYERYMNEAADRGVFNRFPYAPGYELTRGEMAQLLVMLGEPIAILNPDAIAQDPVPGITQQPITGGVCGNGIVEGTEQCDDGNLKNGDGCSKICVIVAEPVRHGALRITEQSISTSAQASGNKDVALSAFRAIAGRQDVYITTLKFKSTLGSLTYAENYRLIIDRDGDGKVETLFARATANGETLTFANLNILVKDGQYMRIELWGDMDTTLTASSLSVSFDITQPDFVEGVDRVDGEDVTGIIVNDGTCMQDDICWITVETISNEPITIRTQGNLYVTQASSTIPIKQLIAGETTDPIMKLHFRTDGEDIVVKELAIEGVPSVVDKLLLYQEGSTNVFTTLSSGYCSSAATGRYCSKDDFTIPRNSEEDVEVRALLYSDEEGANSNESITLTVSAATSGNVAVVAQGAYSGQRLLQNNGNSSAEGEVFIGTESAAPNSAFSSAVHIVTLAKISDIFSSNADADGTPIPVGTTTFAKFTFNAADNQNSKSGYNPVRIEKLTFTIGAINMEFDSSSFYVYNIQNAGSIHVCSADNQTGIITVSCDGLIASQVSTSMARNESLTLALRGTITNPQITPGSSSLQTKIGSLGDPSVTGIIDWSDGVTTFDWVDIGKLEVKSTTYRLE